MKIFACPPPPEKILGAPLPTDHDLEVIMFRRPAYVKVISERLVIGRVETILLVILLVRFHWIILILLVNLGDIGDKWRDANRGPQ